MGIQREVSEQDVKKMIIALDTDNDGLISK